MANEFGDKLSSIKPRRASISAGIQHVFSIARPDVCSQICACGSSTPSPSIHPVHHQPTTSTSCSLHTHNRNIHTLSRGSQEQIKEHIGLYITVCNAEEVTAPIEEEHCTVGLLVTCAS